jgi:hypothetical protein
VVRRTSDTEKWGLGIFSNLEIKSVAPGSPADRAGLKKGEIITHVNGHFVKILQPVLSELKVTSPPLQPCQPVPTCALRHANTSVRCGPKRLWKKGNVARKYLQRRPSCAGGFDWHALFENKNVAARTWRARDIIMATTCMEASSVLSVCQPMISCGVASQHAVHVTIRIPRKPPSA